MESAATATISIAQVENSVNTVRDDHSCSQLAIERDKDATSDLSGDTMSSTYNRSMDEPNDVTDDSFRDNLALEWIQQRTQIGKSVIAQYNLGSTSVEAIVLAGWSRLEGVMQSEDLPLLHNMCKSVVNRDAQWWPDDDEAVPDDDTVTAVSAEEWKIVHSAERFLKVHSQSVDQSSCSDRTSKIADQWVDSV